MKMAPVFVWSRRKDKNIVDLGNEEGEAAEDIIHHALKGGPGVSEAKAGVIRYLSPKGRSDGSLRDIDGIHGDLIVTFQEVQLQEDFCPVKVGRDVSYVGERVMIRFRQHVESSVVTAGVTTWRRDDQGLEAFWQSPRASMSLNTFLAAANLSGANQRNLENTGGLDVCMKW